jgi:hypothetical protein
LLGRVLLRRNTAGILPLDEPPGATHILAMRIALALLLVLLAPLPSPAAERAVCRPNALGAVSCPGDNLRPMPRPAYQSRVQALDRVRAGAQAREQQRGGERFVPSRETRRLGGTTVLPRGTSGPCRPDALGNLRCR